ncbi:MAG: S-layer homology domain-containing protein [Pseudanabaena sp.]
MSLSRTSLRLAFLFTFGLSQIVTLTESSIAQNVTPANTTLPITLQVAQANVIIFVSPNGSDANSGLSADQPLRSLTAALNKNLQSGAIIQLASGTYSAETGEKFPLLIPVGVTLRGNPNNQGQEIIVSGGNRFVSPTFAQQNIAVLAANGSRIEGITLTNKNPRGYALWLESAQNVTITNNTFANSTHDGVFLTGATSANISNNIFTKNGANGLSALGTSTGLIQSNTFDNTGFGLAIGQNSKVAVVSNRIVNNRGGIVVSNLSMPSFRNNLIANNQENGLVILKDRKGQPNVDLGTTSSPGQNIFQNNKQTDINNASGVTIVAIGNQVDPKRVQGSVSLVQPSSPITSPSTPTTPTTQVAFKDVPANYWAQTFIQELASRNIIKGFPDGSFRPNDPVTRAQFAALLSQAMNKQTVRSSATFTDVSSTNWAATAIQKAYTTGFMSGYSATTFRPNENISRVQILVSLANGLGYAPTKPANTTLQLYSDATTVPAYARNSVAAATENRMVVNYPNLKLLNPNQPATRAEVAAFIYQALVRSGQIKAIPSPYIVSQ